MEKLQRGIVRLLGSRRLYWGVVGFLVFEALWIAFSANYPMAFDEDFHLGVIQIYSHHWLPFLSGQPEGANIFGALAVDPSYLYHYAMSFPYRAIAALTDSQMTQVIVLRLLNIAIFTTGVVVLGKVLRRAGTSTALTNAATALFVLIPTVPLLAGQINYDSLFLLVLAWVCWLVLRLTEDIARRMISLKRTGLLLVALLVGCLVKYAFVPIALAVAAYLAVLAWRQFGGHGRQLRQAIATSYAGLSKAWKFGLILMLIISSGLFAQRYGANLVAYHNPLPACDTVIGLEACMEYGPWARNYRLAASKSTNDRDPLAYTWQWLLGLHYRLFFMITGPPKHTNYPPAPLPSAAAIGILFFGAVALYLYSRRVFGGQPFLVFLGALVATYAVTLWLQNYTDYMETGQPVAINGRYLIPLLLPLAAVWGRGLSLALQGWPRVKVWAAGLAIVLFLQGGGVVSFILRSDQSWYWPNSTVVAVNETAQRLLDPIVFEGPTKY